MTDRNETPMTASEMKAKRRILGMTQDQLGQALNRTRWSIVQYEKGDAPIVTEVAQRLDTLFDLRMGASNIGIYSWQAAATIVKVPVQTMGAMIVADPTIATLSPGARAMRMQDRLLLLEGDVDAPYLTQEQINALVARLDQAGGQS